MNSLLLFDIIYVLMVLVQLFLRNSIILRILQFIKKSKVIIMNEPMFIFIFNDDFKYFNIYLN